MNKQFDLAHVAAAFGWFALFLFILAFVLLIGGLFAYMLFWERGRRSLQLALRSLWLHKLRSMLSVLGIIIGTGAVITLMAFGKGSMHEALEDIKRLGATNIIIRGAKPPESNTTTQARVAVYGLTYQDYDLFATIDAVTRPVPMRLFSQEFRYWERNHTGRLV